MTFVDALGQELSQAAISKKDFAVAAGIPPSTLYNWFSVRASEPSVELARLAARARGTTIEGLIRKHSPAEYGILMEPAAAYGNTLAERLYKVAQQLTDDDLEDLIVLAEAKTRRRHAQNLQTNSGS